LPIIPERIDDAYYIFSIDLISKSKAHAKPFHRENRTAFYATCLIKSVV
jgi:hypothetical protein